MTALQGSAETDESACLNLTQNKELSPNTPLSHYRIVSKLGAGGMGEVYLARAYALSGKRDEAMNLVTQLNDLAKQRYVPAFGFAVAHAALGNKDQAFQWLDQSLHDGGWEITLVKVDPSLDSLRSDPRFADLVRRVGL